MVTISHCETKKHLKLFEQLPELIHQDDPYYTPPFPGSISKLFSPKGPFLKKHGELFPLIAWRDGKPVGRIAAIVNRTHNQYYQDKVGFFGFFDFINDEEVARALFQEAEKILKSKGLTSLRGPYNPTLNEECGVLTEGFESAPMVMMIYNPPYYRKIYESLGLVSARNLFAYYLSADTPIPEKLVRVVKRAQERLGVTIRNIDLKNLDEELKVMQKLYNDTLKGNWGFIPIEHEDLVATADDLKQIADPALVLIAERQGTPIGFSLTLPNINEFLWKERKSKGIMRFLKLVYDIKLRRAKEARLIGLGVEPEYRNSGLAGLFVYETWQRGKNKFLGGELSWIDEENNDVIRIIENLGGKKYKSYRIYERPVSNEARA